MRRLTFLLLCLFIGIGVATAQTMKITGNVISSEDQQPVIGKALRLVRLRTLRETLV